MVDAMESDLSGTLWDIMQAADEKRPPGIGGHRSYIFCHLKIL
jgi:hypothetical protein